MDLFTTLFGSWLTLVYHCFDRMVISGYLMGLLKPGQVAHWLRASENVPGVTKQILARRTTQYVNWVESFARNQRIPIEWAEKGVRKEDYVLPYLRRAERQDRYGVYFIFQAMEQGWTFKPSKIGDQIQYCVPWEDVADICELCRRVAPGAVGHQLRRQQHAG